MNLLKEEFRNLDLWANSVAKKFPETKIRNIQRDEIYDNIISAVYLVDGADDISASYFNDVIYKQGLKFARGRRYFWCWDKEKKFMFLLFYPFYIDLEGSQNDPDS